MGFVQNIKGKSALQCILHKNIGFMEDYFDAIDS